MTHSYFNSAFTTVADALETGKCTLISNAMVHKVLVDRDRNRARGVLYIDRNTRQAREVYARVVILCAQSQESVRILFNSATQQYPNGLANSSGVLGHYLTAHVRSGGGSGEFPSFGARPSLGGPHKPVGIYIARFRNLPNAPPYKKFIRGYGYEGESTMRFNWGAPGFGEAYKKALLEPRSGIARMGADPKKSVLNQFQQTHDVKNLFVMDASGFPSNPCQNPTLTIMALCVRSCDYLMAELKRNSL